MARTPEEPTEAAPRRMPTWLLFGGGLLMLLLAAAWFAPLIVAGTPLLNHFAAQAVPAFRGKIHIAGANLGWLSPVELQQIAIHDEKGELLAKAESVQVAETLLDLLQDTSRLSQVTIAGPHVRLVVRADGTNLEDALAPILAAPSAGKSPRPKIAVTGGTAEIIDAASERTWKADELTATVTPARTVEEPWTADVSLALATASGNKQPLTATAKWLMPDKGAYGSGTAEAKSDALPLDLVSFLAARFAPGAAAQGQAGGKLTAKWSDGDQGSPLIDLAGDLRGQGVRLSAPAYLGPDALELGAIAASGGVELRGNRYTAREVRLQSDIASVGAEGSFTSDLLASASLTALAQAAAAQDFELAARVDLARLAKQLPSVVRLREGTQLTAGQIEASFASRGVPAAAGASGKRTWVGRVDTSKVSAIDNGRVLTWDDPLRISLSAYDTGEGVVLEKLACEASFLQLAAQGTREQGKLTAVGDLDRLAAELGRFLDLSGIQLAGKLNGELAWRKQEGGRLAASADVALTQWQLALPQRPAWTEPELRATAQATLAFDRGTAVPGREQSANGLGNPLHGLSLDAAQAVLVAQQDRLDLSLTQPVTHLSLTTPLPLKARCRGELARWMPRLAPFVALPGISLGGTIDLDTTAAVSTQAIELGPTVVQVAQLVVVTPDLRIDDPQVRVETSGIIDLVNRQVRSPETTVVGTALSLRATQLSAALPGRVTGDFAFRGDLNRLQRWLPATQTAGSVQYTGQLVGTASLIQEEGRLRGQTEATIDQLALLQLDSPPAGPRMIPAASGPPVWKTLWAEPRVALKADGSYDLAKDVVTLGGCDANNGAARLTAAGTIAQCSTRPTVDLTGELATDLALASQRFRGLFGPVQMEGRETRPFTIRGPLTVTAVATSDPNAIPISGQPLPSFTPFVSPELDAQGGLGWTAIAAQGLQFGPGVLDGRLNQGVLQFAPLDVAVGGDGRLRGAARVDLRGPAPVLAVEPGRVLDNIRFSPDLCRSWLKYVTPILADVTTIEGAFSLQLAEANVPLLQPHKATARGVLLIQGAHAGPGPVGQSFLGIFKQLKAIIDRKGLLGGSPNQQTWIDLKDQQVEFQLIDGRVHHRGMAMVVGNVPLRTAGSVGLDQSLDVQTEVPILDQWVQKDPLLGGLRGQTLTIPLRGTLLAPKADGKVIKDLAEKLTGGLINDILRPVLPGQPPR